VTPRSLVRLVGVLFGLVLWTGMATVTAQAQGAPAFGAGFGVTDADGAAWPGAKGWWAGTCDLSSDSTSVGGVGTPPAERAHCFDHGQPYRPLLSDPDPDPPRDTVWQPGSEPSWRLDPVAAAGAHPDATASFWLNRYPVPFGGTALQGDGDTRTVHVQLPPGFVGNPNAVPRCTSRQLQTTPPSCPPETQVGVATVTVALLDQAGARQSVFPVWNAEPRDGKAAEFMLSPAGNPTERANIPVVANARTDDDFGVDVVAVDVPGGLPLLGQTITLWGVPWAASHDAYRAPTDYNGHTPGPEGALAGMPETGLPDPHGAQPQSYDLSWGPIKPFLTNPTECAPSVPITTLHLTSWQSPVPRSTDAPADVPVDGCGGLDFPIDAAMAPTTTAADSASGLGVDLRIPQEKGNAPASPSDGATPGEVDDYVESATAYWASDDGRAPSQLDRAVVTLPPGVSVNPAGATGLQACSDAEIGLTAAGNPSRFNNVDPFDGQGVECPPGSRIGTADVFTPLLPGADPAGNEANLSGEVVLGMPKSTDPQSGEMFRLFIVVRNKQRGLLAKIAGSAVADPATGQLTATFDKNPRVPFEWMHLEMKGGGRGMLATPPNCGDAHWSSAFTPWSAAHGAGGVPVPDGGAFAVDANCADGFAPGLRAGMSSRQAGGTGTFGFQLTRQDGEQYFQTVSAKLPRGLLASVRGVQLCTDAQAAAAACPPGSRIGSVDAGAGSGTPFFLEQPGSVFLTEGYKGAPYGMSVQVPVEAGPFRGPLALTTMVVRQALHVDRSTADVTAVSDPLPQIWHGIPLRVRQLTVTVDRPSFMRNPTDCSPKRIAADVGGASGAVATPSAPFRASGCRALRFRPKIGMRLIGRRQTITHKHPGVRAVVTQKAGEAGIRRAKVLLPRSLALDPDNAQALCEFEDGTKPDLENHCPKGSIVGRARAVSPLLNRPLTGNVYFVKNVRIDPISGQPRRTLPMIIAALRGEIAINLRGESDVGRGGRLVSTFPKVPDAPVSRFSLNIEGGRNGILVVTATRRGKIDICRSKQVAESNMNGHNGRRHNVNVRMKTPCKAKRRQARRR
jgi:hypothetical protein